MYLWLSSLPKSACTLCTNRKKNMFFFILLFVVISITLNVVLVIIVSVFDYIYFKTQKKSVSALSLFDLLLYSSHMWMYLWLYSFRIRYNTLNDEFHLVKGKYARKCVFVCARESVCVCARMRVCAMVCWCDLQNTATHCNTLQHRISTLQRVRIFEGVSCHPFTSVTLFMNQATHFEVQHDSWMTRFWVWHDSCRSETFAKSSSVVCAQESWHTQEWVMSNVWRDTF